MIKVTFQEITDLPFESKIRFLFIDVNEDIMIEYE